MAKKSSPSSPLASNPALCWLFKTTDQYLRDQDKQVNIAIGASVDQINNYAKQIASLNDQISR
ncbi:hypothetical protein MMS56_28975, partial [Escherichia coli]|nr:hypothetical protein [Escherichia coli]